MSERLRIAMIGGGPTSFIGPMHRLGAFLSGNVDLVAGVFSRDPDRTRAIAREYGIDPARGYPDFEALLSAEKARDDGVQAITIATPNHLHLPVALAAIKAGLHIISDKPATATLQEALILQNALSDSSSHYALTYTYSAFPMVREARARIASGVLGDIRKINVTYSQGWLAKPLENAGLERAAWRTDPARSGIGGCSADIGVHAFHLAEFISGIKVSAVLPDVSSMLDGRQLDDDCNALLRFANGARGVLSTSQIAFGERNGLSIQIYGSSGALAWSVEQADQLRWTRADGICETLTPLSPDLLAREVLPPGLGNGIVAPFAILYRDFANVIAGKPGADCNCLPGIADGVRSMAFIEKVVSGSRTDTGWINF